MKLFLLISAAATLLLSSTNCDDKKSGKTYKGRLEVSGICSNITISVIGDPGELAVEKNWTDETTNITYSNAFALGNPCNFPAGLKPGQEFSFSIDTSQQKDCAVCMAYYPKPSKALNIKVITP